MSKSGNTYPVRRRKAPESVEVKIDIRPGPGSLAQKQAWRKFWARLISKAKCEQ